MNNFCIISKILSIKTIECINLNVMCRERQSRNIRSNVIANSKFKLSIIGNKIIAQRILCKHRIIPYLFRGACNICDFITHEMLCDYLFSCDARERMYYLCKYLHENNIYAIVDLCIRTVYLCIQLVCNYYLCDIMLPLHLIRSLIYDVTDIPF